MTTNTTERKSELTIVRRPSGVAIILFDSTAKFNALGAKVREELFATLAHLRDLEGVKGVICLSGKPDTFIIGADLPEIRKCASRDEVYELSNLGHKLLDELYDFPLPVVAAINGSCLGGGVELALACHKRVATKEKSTIFAMPETRLGLIPGLGGTQRLPAVIGLKAALDMILTSNTITAEEALANGLVDELVDSANLIEAAEKVVLELAKSPEWQRPKDKLVKATPQCRVPLEPEKAQKLLAITERAIRLRTKGNYPAQLEAIKVIREGLTHGIEKGMEAEANSFADLAVGDVAANLISLFFNTDFAKASAQSMVAKVNGSAVKTLGLVGAGVMGTGLAERAAAAGINVILKTNPSKIDVVKDELRQLAIRTAHQQASSKADAASEKEALLQTILDRITIVSDERNLESADLILECVIEDEVVKRELLKHFSQHKDSLILATGTSSLSVTKLAEAVSKPENFMGIHFFQPVALMPLVELIAQPNTAKQTLARAMDLVLKLEKTPIVVKDSPGFLINRLLTVYLFELARLAGEAFPLNWVEETMLEFGMPMGPLQLMDEIGIDVAFTVASKLEEGFGERMKSPETFHKVRAIGLLGRRSNVGFYLWEGGEKRVKVNPDMLEKTGAVWSEEKCPESEKAKIIERMLYPMIDEAARCLEEKVISKAREIDFALILGIGFPAFRGGLLRYADTQGMSHIISRLEEIYSQSAASGTASKREVSQLLRNYAQAGRSFYSLNG